MTGGRKLRKSVLRVLAVISATVIALGLGELFVLLSGVNNDYRSMPVSVLEPRPEGPFELSPHGHVPYARLHIRYATDSRDYFGDGKMITHHFNSEGWRDQERDRVPSEGTFRILGLGDSYTFGQGVRAEDCFLRKLEESLRAAVPNQAFETVNTGQPGYNTAMEFQLLERQGFNYNPDLVLLAFVPNDVEPDIYTEDTKVEFFTEFTASYTGSDWLSERSELWSLARRKILYHKTSQDYLTQSIESYLHDSEKWDVCSAALLRIKGACEQRGIPLVLAVFPFFVQLDQRYPFQPIHDHVMRFCSEQDIPAIDLKPHYSQYSGPELWVHPTDQHPNDLAHKVAADAICEFLVSRLSGIHPGVSAASEAAIP